MLKAIPRISLFSLLIPIVTFPYVKQFHTKEMESDIEVVLGAYLLFRDDIGYRNGISCLSLTTSLGMVNLVAILLHYLDTYNAFQCFANIINQIVYTYADEKGEKSQQA